MAGLPYWLKHILDLIKILSILPIAQVMLKVLVDLMFLVSINLNNPVLHKTSGHAPHTHFSSAKNQTLYGEKLLLAFSEPVPDMLQKIPLLLHIAINHLQVNKFYQLFNLLCGNILG